MTIYTHYPSENNTNRESMLVSGDCAVYCSPDTGRLTLDKARYDV